MNMNIKRIYTLKEYEYIYTYTYIFLKTVSDVAGLW